MRRLTPYLNWNEVSGRNQALYANIHKLAGLEQCLRERTSCGFLKPSGMCTSCEISDSHSRDHVVNHQTWLSRPLSKQNLQYAATDIELIKQLFCVFKQRGYIDSDLPKQSLRYTTVWKETQPTSNEPLKSHPLLPLETLQTPSFGITKSCHGCGRALSQRSFSPTAWTSQPGRQCNCLVCCAVKTASDAKHVYVPTRWEDIDDLSHYDIYEDEPDEYEYKDEDEDIYDWYD